MPYFRSKLLIISVLFVSIFSSVGVITSTMTTHAITNVPTGTSVHFAQEADDALVNKIVTRAKITWPWYITRGSGLIAAVLLVVLMLWGIGMITGYTFRFVEPLTAWATHRALGLAFLGAVLIHIGSLIFDKFISFNIIQLLLPFASQYKKATLFGIHVGSIWVAFGIVAFYGLIAVILSSLLWVEKKPHTWKILHFISYLIMIFVFIHALYIGTDLAHGILRWLWIIGGISVAIAIIIRLYRARTI